MKMKFFNEDVSLLMKISSPKQNAPLKHPHASKAYSRDVLNTFLRVVVPDLF